ncbi:MAG: hypothetical protein R2755_03440 [Acidimicrobiales bacterium]
MTDLPDAIRQDPVFHRSNGALPGRDGCRIPLPWTADEHAAFGFSSAAPDIPNGMETVAGGPASTWLPQPTGWGRFAADLQAGEEASMLELYRRTLAARRHWLHEHPAGLAWLPAPPGCCCSPGVRSWWRSTSPVPMRSSTLRWCAIARCC